MFDSSSAKNVRILVHNGQLSFHSKVSYSFEFFPFDKLSIGFSEALVLRCLRAIAPVMMGTQKQVRVKGLMLLYHGVFSWVKPNPKPKPKPKPKPTSLHLLLSNPTLMGILRLWVGGRNCWL